MGYDYCVDKEYKRETLSARKDETLYNNWPECQDKSHLQYTSGRISKEQTDRYMLYQNNHPNTWLISSIPRHWNPTRLDIVTDEG